MPTTHREQCEMQSGNAARVLVTHPRSRLASYFGAQALQRLRQVAEVRLNERDQDLEGQLLIDAAQDCSVIIAYRQTPVDAQVLAALPALRAVVRCAVDIRTIDVAAASAQGVLVTQASPGFMASVSEWLAQSDFVVCLAPANPGTEDMFDAGAFASMQRGAFFINAARGNLVDEAALLQALESRHLGGAALDVGRAANQMPPPSLARHPAVIATPHIGGLTPPAIEHQALESVAQATAILQGRIPVGAVNADAALRLCKHVLAGA